MAPQRERKPVEETPANNREPALRLWRQALEPRGTLVEKKESRKASQRPWDKVTAISGLASGLAVALIGFYATNVYNRRQASI